MPPRKKLSLLNRIALASERFLQDPGAEEEIRGYLREFTYDHLNFNPRKIAAEDGKVYYHCLHECQEFSFEIFLLGKGACIPLHDHPNMTVMSKVLYGEAHFATLDWVQAEAVVPKNAKSGFARVMSHARATATSEPRTLYPRFQGNLHEIYAVRPTLLFDIMLPPYSDDEGRPCHYFGISNQKHETFSSVRDLLVSAGAGLCPGEEEALEEGEAAEGGAGAGEGEGEGDQSKSRQNGTRREGRRHHGPDGKKRGGEATSHQQQQTSSTRAETSPRARRAPVSLEEVGLVELEDLEEDHSEVPSEELRYTGASVDLSLLKCRSSSP